MTLLDTAAQDISLDNDYGATKGSTAPASLEVALFTGNPLLGGTELTSAGGYVRPVVANDGTTWPTAASGGAKTMAPVTFPAPTGAYSDTATWFVLIDHADSTTRWDGQELSEEIDITAAGPAFQIQPKVYYENTGA
jgi:hypothetical protein